jgi:hypothetical protein
MNYEKRLAAEKFVLRKFTTKHRRRHWGELDAALRKAGHSRNPNARTGWPSATLIRNMVDDKLLRKVGRGIYERGPARHAAVLARRDREKTDARKLRERPMTKAFWQRHCRGAYLPEYRIVSKAAGQEARYVDAAIIAGARHRYTDASRRYLSLRGHDVTLVETKAGRLNRYHLGQGVFAGEQAKHQGARRVRVVLLCSKADAAIMDVISIMNARPGSPRIEVWTCDRDEPGRCERVRHVRRVASHVTLAPAAPIAIKNPNARVFRTGRRNPYEVGCGKYERTQIVLRSHGQTVRQVVAKLGGRQSTLRTLRRDGIIKIA